MRKYKNVFEGIVGSMENESLFALRKFCMRQYRDNSQTISTINNELRKRNEKRIQQNQADA